MDWSAAAAAGIGALGQIAGGLLSRPDHSQRDLMHMSHEFWQEQAVHGPRLRTVGLRKAGLNPILAVSQPPPQAQAIPAPQPYTDPMGKAVGDAASSAASVYVETHRARQLAAQTKLMESQAKTAEAEADLKREQAKTEPDKRWHLNASADQAHSAARLADENRKIAEVTQLIQEQNLTIAQKDAIIASIDAELMQSGVGDISRALQAFNLKPDQAMSIARLLLQVFRRKGR